MKPFCFSKQHIIPTDQASIHPIDIGLIRGYAIFDFFRVEGYRPLFLEGYLDRFVASAKSCALPLDYSRNDIRDLVETLIEKNDMEQGGIRMVLSGGISDNKFSPANGHLYIFCEPLKLPSQLKYENGIQLLSQEYLRPLPEIKTTNYTLPVWLSLGWANKNAEDVIYHHGGIISESSRSNIFIIKEGEISTPRANVLRGITRKNILKIAEEVQERDIAFSELLDAEEAFICSTTKRILPVTQIDGQRIGQGKPGKITRSLMEKIEQLELQDRAHAN